jgi:hypothetical protein
MKVLEDRIRRYKLVKCNEMKSYLLTPLAELAKSFKVLIVGSGFVPHRSQIQKGVKPTGLIPFFL